MVLPLKIDYDSCRLRQASKTEIQRRLEREHFDPEAATAGDDKRRAET
jgi:hypothetical protein